MIDVIDAVEHFTTVDTLPNPPLRYAAASLVVVGKTDLLPEPERGQVIARIRQRVRERNAHAPLLVAHQGRIDPALVFDTAAPAGTESQDELPIAQVLREPTQGHDEHPHEHARSASEALRAPVSPSALIDLLEYPPGGAYRIKGRVRVRGPKADRGYLVNLVGRAIHVAALPNPPSVGELVAIGPHLDADAAHGALRTVATTPSERPDATGLRRLWRYRRLSD
jgi:G3E family GTPase